MNSATVIISRWGDDPLTLRGAKVAAFRAGFGQLARSFAEMENLDYEWIMAASVKNIFIAGAVDATLARSYDEYYQLLQTRIIQPDTGILGRTMRPTGRRPRLSPAPAAGDGNGRTNTRRKRWNW